MLTIEEYIARRKSHTNFRNYDYDIKQKSNLFNIDSLYRKMPKKQ